jgi:hypothetical protein
MKVRCKCDTTKSTWDDAVIGHRIDGEIVCVDTYPGEVAPQNNYDPMLVNEQEIDVMGGELDNRSATESQRAFPMTLQQQAYYIVTAPVEGCLKVEMTGNNVLGAEWYMFIYYRKKETARG